MAEAKNTNYDEDTTAQLLQLYEEHGTEGLSVIAEILGKPVRSIRSKLVREGVYQPQTKNNKKTDGPSKKELLRDIEAKGFDVNGFESATKPALERLLNLVAH
jgi:hypothetical protein